MKPKTHNPLVLPSCGIKTEILVTDVLKAFDLPLDASVSFNTDRLVVQWYGTVPLPPQPKGIVPNEEDQEEIESADRPAERCYDCAYAENRYEGIIFCQKHECRQDVDNRCIYYKWVGEQDQE